MFEDDYNDAEGGGPASSGKIFVGNLPFSADQKSVEKLFRPFGDIIGVNLREDRATGRPKGFGFVTFRNASCVGRAIQEMNCAEVDGRQLTVNHADKRGTKEPKEPKEKGPKKPAAKWTSWQGPELAEGEAADGGWDDGW